MPKAAYILLGLVKAGGAGLMAAVFAHTAVLLLARKVTGDWTAAKGHAFTAAMLAFLAIGAVVAWRELRRGCA